MDSSSDLLKGSIGVAKRVHYLDQINPYENWASSYCKTWAGQVTLSDGPVTCKMCASLDPNTLHPTKTLES